MPKNKQKFIIIDSNALIHRAFHALPPLTNKEGQIVNAVYGYATILIKAIKDIKPNFIAATFDLPGKTFRHEAYEEYKATRVKQPDELYAQIPIVKELLTAFNIPIFEKAGFEADDIIGTIAHLKSVDNASIDSIIMTGDHDVLQLVDNNTKALLPHKGMSETILYDEKAVMEKYGGLKPNQLIDYKAICGDTSDNIPGVKGIGPKGAIGLIKDFETLENIYQNIDSPKIKDRLRSLLIEYKDEAKLSKKLATIDTAVPIDFDLKQCAFEGFDKAAVLAIFQRLNFKKLMEQLFTLENKRVITGDQISLFGPDTTTRESGNTKNQEIKKSKNQKIDYQIVKSEKELKTFIAQLKKQKEFCFDTETTGIDPFMAELLGISFSWKNNVAFYLPQSLVVKAGKNLKDIFANDKIKKIGHNLKYDIEIMREAGFEANGLYFDTMLASYLMNPGSRQYALDTLAFVELGRQMQTLDDLMGQGQTKIAISEIPVDKLGMYSCDDAAVTWELYQKFQPQLEKENLVGLFEKIDIPLVKVLAKTEKNGVKIDPKILKTMSQKLTQEIATIENSVYKACGEKFNLASPKQLKEMLFEKMNLGSQGLKKTKSGISTAAGELEKLAILLRQEDAPKKQRQLIDSILEFREYSKLKNTYLEALPELINKKDGRIHTNFNQTIAATGRLSSTNPNLQNIPIRTKWGKKIRCAFIAEKGFKILKADYSQIELRIVASLANDKAMLKAFDQKEDIHTQTSAIIHDVKPEEVTKEMRRQAKEINFGVLYGMGSWGLAQRTGLPENKAREFIDKYFATYKQVREYIDETIKMTKEAGYVENFYGRRRYLPEINSGMSQVRKAAERMAVNTPIQGTAADILKMAMIEIDRELPKVSPRSKMILQVHDELVFEVPEKDVLVVAKLVKEKMNGVYKLRAPIATDVEVGDNWGTTEIFNF